jgi:hypothetical protein
MTSSRKPSSQLCSGPKIPRQVIVLQKIDQTVDIVTAVKLDTKFFPLIGLQSSRLLIPFDVRRDRQYGE